MIIEPKCPKCGENIKVKINKVTMLELKIKQLEKEISELRAVMKFKENNSKPDYSDLFGVNGLFRG